MTRWSWIAIAVAVALASTAALAQPGGGSGSSDAGSSDAGSSDAGSSDAGSSDAGSNDAGSGSAVGGAGSGSAVDGAGSGAGPGSARVIQIPTDASAPLVSAAAAPTVVRLGGRFTVFVTATFGDGVEVNLREPIELGGAFEVRRKLAVADRRAPDGRKTREWQFEVAAWELGDLVMPGIAVTFTALGRAGQVETNAIRLKITGVLGDMVDAPKAMRDHAPPSALMSRDWFWVWVAGIAACTLGGVLGVAIYLRDRKRRTTRLVGGAVARPRRIDTTSERALERLLAVEHAGVLDRDDDRKAGYAAMVEVIRDYLGSRYRIPTLDLTSRELLRKLAQVAPAAEHALVDGWLERCDIVKYGGGRATPADAHRTLDDARALIVTTTAMQGAAGAPPAPPPTRTQDAA